VRWTGRGLTQVLSSDNAGARGDSGCSVGRKSPSAAGAAQSLLTLPRPGEESRQTWTHTHTLTYITYSHIVIYSSTVK
jgi:hypothetical protein